MTSLNEVFNTVALHFSQVYGEIFNRKKYVVFFCTLFCCIIIKREKKKVLPKTVAVTLNKRGAQTKLPVGIKAKRNAVELDHSLLKAC